MHTKIVFFIVLLTKTYFSEMLQITLHPDRDLTISQILQKYGYPMEVHTIITEDGYILTAYRLPRGRKTVSSGSNSRPVLMVHGTCGCSENFIIPGPGKAIAYYLADRDFDVWLLNTRGNRHSRRHLTLDPDKDNRFWDFGWHEIGVYDIPSAIDYILKITNKTDLFYIGHSRGTTSYFAFASERPEYNNKIKVSVNMAPSCLLSDTRTLVKVLGKHVALIQSITKFLNIYELFPKHYNDLVNFIAKTVCAETSILVDFCYAFLYGGEASGDMDPVTPQFVFSTSPGRCSVKELLHYFQIVYSEFFYLTAADFIINKEIVAEICIVNLFINMHVKNCGAFQSIKDFAAHQRCRLCVCYRRGIFRQYDYGPRGNLKIYGSKSPPLYSFSNMTSPIALFYTAQDNLCPKKGVLKLVKLLPNLALQYEVPSDNFGHVDFIFGKNVVELVNKPVYELFKQYSDDNT